MIAAIIPIHDRTLAFSTIQEIPFVQQMVQALQNSRVLDIVLIFDGNTEIPSLPWFNGTIALNARPHHTLSSIITGIDTILDNTVHGVLICPLTAPLLSQSLIVDILQGFWRSHNNIVIPVYKGKRGTPVLVAVPLFDDVRCASSLEAFLETHQDDLVEINTDEEAAVTVISSVSEIESTVLREKT